jgi:hypothetical protein
MEQGDRAESPARARAKERDDAEVYKDDAEAYTEESREDPESPTAETTIGAREDVTSLRAEETPLIRSRSTEPVAP